MREEERFLKGIGNIMEAGESLQIIQHARVQPQVHEMGLAEALQATPCALCRALSSQRKRYLLSGKGILCSPCPPSAPILAAFSCSHSSPVRDLP